MAALNINPTVFETEGGRKYLGSVYNLLQNIEPLYLKYRESIRKRNQERIFDLARISLSLTMCLQSQENL